ncbi:MAG: hypothetical protein IH613_04950 [Desulfuromonadales bacterium]|nr:hypothetical protein [Desulfuromonadales bacterium]
MTTITNSALKESSERTVDLWLIGIEFLLYFSMTCRVFGAQFGILNIYGLSGAIILASAVLAFVIMIFRHESIPVSVYFALIISIIANITDLYFYELFNRNMVYWLSFLMMACFITRNDAALFRFIVFLSTCVLISVYLGGQWFDIELGHTRLGLTGNAAGSMFANPNALAQFAALTSTALLFYSIRCRLATKLFCLVLAVSLSSIVLMTLSRTGLLMFGLGLFCYIVALLIGRKGGIDLLILALLAFVAITVFAVQFDNITTGYYYRMQTESDRITYWQSASEDMLDTLFSGQGSYAGFTSTGIKPHNTFLWLHLAFGGFCAWFYVGWLAWLGCATFKCMFLNVLSPVEKLELGAFFIMFLMVQFVAIFAPANFGFILGIAIIEKHLRAGRPADYTLPQALSGARHA